MAVQILSRRSSILYDRPNPIRLGAAELAVNNNAGEPDSFSLIMHHLLQG